MVWEIYSYGSGEYLRQVFNAIAMIFGNGDYFDAWRIVTLVTFIGIMIKVAFSREGAAHFRYVMTVIFIVYTLFIPKTRVVITDTIVPSNSATVANVPIGIAMTAGAFSKFGYWMTKTTETVFGMPTQNKPTKTGFLFYSQLFEQLNKATISDKRTAENYRKFFASCVIVDGIGHKRFSWEDVVNAPNLDNFFKTRTANTLAGFFYTDSGGASSFQFCRQGYSKISTDLIGTMPQTLKKISVPWVKDYNGVNNAANFLKNNLGITVAEFTGQTTDVNTIMKQYMGSNELHAALAAFSADVNDTTTSNYIIARANTERSTTFKAVGRVAAERLPLVRVVMEGIIYALFPFIGLMMLASPLAVGATYLKALIWINLWAPIFALIHFAKVSFDTDRITGMVEVYGGLTANGINHLNNYMSDASSIAGYLMGGLPVITWILLSRSGAMMASMTSRVTDGFEKAVEKGAEDTTAGSGSALGKDWRMSQQNAIKDNMAFAGQNPHNVNGLTVSSVNESGTVMTQSLDGTTALQQIQSGTLLNQSAKENFTAKVASDYQQAAANLENVTAKLTESQLAALTTQKQRLDDFRQSEQYNSSIGNTVQNQLNKSQTNLTNDMKSYADKNGFSEITAANAALSLGARAGLISGAGGAETKALSTEEEQFIKAYSTSRQGATTLSNITTDINKQMRSSGVDSSKAYSDSISSSLTQLTSATREHSSAIQEIEQASYQMGIAHSMSQNRDVDMTSVMINHHVNNAGIGRRQAAEEIDSIIRRAANGDEKALEEFGKMYEQVAGKPLNDRSTVENSYNPKYIWENSNTGEHLKYAEKQMGAMHENNNTRVTGSGVVNSVNSTLGANANPQAGVESTNRGANWVERPNGYNENPSNRSPTATVINNAAANANNVVNATANNVGRTAAGVVKFGNKIAQDPKGTAQAAVILPAIAAKQTVDFVKKFTNNAVKGFNSSMDGNPKK